VHSFIQQTSILIIDCIGTIRPTDFQPRQCPPPKPFSRQLYQVNALLPFCFLLRRIFLPFFDFVLASHPCLRFCTLREGLNVLRGARRGVEVEKERVDGGVVDSGGVGVGRVAEGGIRERWEKKD
jgi:hypothetical protein